MSTLYILAGIPGAGKAQPVDTIIPTPDGDKRLGDIKVGDYVFDRLGKPTKVLGVYPQGKLDNYKVTFKDGRSTYCNDGHLWSYYTSKGNLKTVPLKEFLEKGLCLESQIRQYNKHHHKFYIPTNKCVEYTEKPLEVHPYIVGAFLGDGCCLQNQLTISSNDEFIVNKISKLLPIQNVYVKNSTKNYNWHFRAKNKAYYPGRKQYIYTKEIFSQMKNELMQYSYNKRIPKKYLTGSKEQRLELLRGLLDTDGSISIYNNKFDVSFTSASKQLIDDVSVLVRSLGFRVGKINVDKRKAKYTNECYSLPILVDNKYKELLFSLPRKKKIGTLAKKYKKRARYDRISITNIEKMPQQEEMVCIYVGNNEHLYLTNDFIVTHNTTFANENKDLGLVVSRDAIRFRFMDEDPDCLSSMDYFKYEDDVIKEFYGTINKNLKNGHDVIADATHITLGSLKKTVKNCGKYADDICLVYFNRGLDIALPHNAKRTGREHVPEDVIKRMWKNRYQPFRAQNAGLVDRYVIM